MNQTPKAALSSWPWRGISSSTSARCASSSWFHRRYCHWSGYGGTLLPDVTGDGTRDSVADTAGHYVEMGWDLLRNEGVDAAKDVGNYIADGVTDLAESASESNLNPMNWFD